MGPMGGKFCRGTLTDCAGQGFGSAFVVPLPTGIGRFRNEKRLRRGHTMPALTFFFAFVAVLALIGAAAWLVRRFAGNRLGANANRGRMPRLAVIDAAAVDGRRRLVLVRRGKNEHPPVIGGPAGTVGGAKIVRAP